MTALLPGAFLLVAAVLVAPPAAAQVETSAPVHVKVKTPKVKTESYAGEVMNFTPIAVTVRSRSNNAVLRTFHFSPGLARKVENKRMEYGDRITLRVVRGTDTAVDIKGRLRKADRPVVR